MPNIRGCEALDWGQSSSSFILIYFVSIFLSIFHSLILLLLCFFQRYDNYIDNCYCYCYCCWPIAFMYCEVKQQPGSKMADFEGLSCLLKTNENKSCFLTILVNRFYGFFTAIYLPYHLKQLKSPFLTFIYSGFKLYCATGRGKTP